MLLDKENENQENNVRLEDTEHGANNMEHSSVEQGTIAEQLPAEPEWQSPEPPTKLSVYDLIYGILFDSVSTFRKVGNNPPVGLTLVLILGLNFLLALIGTVTANHQPLTDNMMGYANDQIISTMQSMAPIMAMMGFIFNTVVWFVYSGLLHLIAEFFGGKGRAVSTFTVYGLAGLPSLFLLPIQVLEMIFNQSTVISVVSIIGTLAVVIWGIVLLVIGLREIHQINTGKAILVVASPWIVGFGLAIITVISMIGLISSAMPYLEQFGKM